MSLSYRFRRRKEEALPCPRCREPMEFGWLHFHADGGIHTDKAVIAWESDKRGPHSKKPVLRQLWRGWDLRYRVQRCRACRIVTLHGRRWVPDRNLRIPPLPEPDAQERESGD